MSYTSRLNICNHYYLLVFSLPGSMLHEGRQYFLFIFCIKKKKQNKTETSTNAIGYPSQPDPIAETTKYLCHQTWRDQSGAQLEALPLLTNIILEGTAHNSGGRKKSSVYTPPKNPESYHSNLPEK